MRKRLLLLGAVLGLGLCVGLGTGSKFVPALAEGEEEVTEPVAETYTITLEQPEHGKVIIAEEDLEGEVGKDVTIDIQPSIFYLVKSVTVNGNALVESETTKGIYTFKPTAGENKIVITIVTDNALIEEFNTISQQVKNKDWASVFSVETITRLVAIVLNSGMLVAIATYFIKDKRLSKKVGDRVETTVKEIIPDQTKEAVTNAVKELVTPIFEKNEAQIMKMMQALSVFSKCMALSQENTAESRKAILDELASLEIGDMATIQQIKDFIHNEITAQRVEYEENMKAMKEIEEKNSAIVEPQPKKEIKIKEEEREEEEEEEKYDGTEI